MGFWQQGLGLHSRTPEYSLLSGAPRGHLTKVVTAEQGWEASLLLPHFLEVTTQGTLVCSLLYTSVCVLSTHTSAEFFSFWIVRTYMYTAVYVSHALCVDIFPCQHSLLCHCDLSNGPRLSHHDCCVFSPALFLDTWVSPAFHQQQMLFQKFPLIYVHCPLAVRDTGGGVETNTTY